MTDKNDFSIARACFTLLIAAAGYFPSPVALAEEPDERGVTERAKEEASLPYRWIIESSKIERRRQAERESVQQAKGREGPPAGEARAAVATGRVSKAGQSRPPARRAQSMLAASGSEGARHADVVTDEVQDAAATSSREEPVQEASAAAAPQISEEAIKPAAHTFASEEGAHDEQEPLIPIQQEPPYVWPGFCAKECSSYVYKVVYKVMPSGAVAGVKVVGVKVPDVNAQMLSRAVYRAVSQWKYKPLSAMRDVEITFRLADR